MLCAHRWHIRESGQAAPPNDPARTIAATGATLPLQLTLCDFSGTGELQLVALKAHVYISLMPLPSMPFERIAGRELEKEQMPPSSSLPFGSLPLGEEASLNPQSQLLYLLLAF